MDTRFGLGLLKIVENDPLLGFFEIQKNPKNPKGLAILKKKRKKMIFSAHSKETFIIFWPFSNFVNLKKNVVISIF